MTRQEIKINKQGFVEFENRDWGYKGDKGTWAKLDPENGVFTVQVARSGRISSAYAEEISVVCDIFGINFSDLCPGERATAEFEPEPKTEQAADAPAKQGETTTHTTPATSAPYHTANPEKLVAKVIDEICSSVGWWLFEEAVIAAVERGLEDGDTYRLSNGLTLTYSDGTMTATNDEGAVVGTGDTPEQLDAMLSLLARRANSKAARESGNRRGII